MRRTFRVLDQQHGHAVRERLVRPTMLLLLMTGVASVAALGGHVGSTLRVRAASASTAQPAPQLQAPAAVSGAPGPPAEAPQPGLLAAPLPPIEAVQIELPTPIPPALAKGALPIGKGMWIWQPEQVEGGDVTAMVGRATAAGLTHVYVRMGSSVDGFTAGPFLDALLPAAHAAGLRVYGWDFPYFRDVNADLRRGVDAIRYTTPDGQRIDGFSPDIETQSEGVSLNAENAAAYATALRAAVGPGVPLIATVPRPSGLMQAVYPYAQVLGPFDAVAPMVYWLNRQPDTDVAGAVDFLAAFGKPVIPIGQAYDGGLEGGRPGPPTPDEIQRFMSTADAHGAAGVSFWSWQHADQSVWDTIAASPQFTLPSGPVVDLAAGQVRSLQVLLSSVGFATPVTGQWDATTSASLLAFQQAWSVPPTGVVDDLTRSLLLHPLAPPLP
jgi:hypothetical protein